MREKLERIVLWILLISLPFQTRIILDQPDWYFNEYTAIVLYATDLLLIALGGLWITQKGIRVSPPGAIPVLLGGLIILGAISAGTLDTPAGWYHWIKLLEGVFLFFYVRSRSILFAAPALVIGGVLQALLGIAQFVRQSDVGLRFLGETILMPDMRGVAVFLNDAGEKVLRAYGTMPHPNILAMYLLLALCSWYVLFLTKRKPWWTWLAYGATLFAFFATFARIIIGVWALAGIMIGIYLWMKNPAFRRELRKIFIGTVVLAGVFSGLFYHDVIGRFTIHQSDESIVLRNYYNSRALHTGDGINWRGIGIGNFVPWLMEHDPGLRRDLYQPAHNVYLLLYAELGLLGIAFFAGVSGLLMWRLWHRRAYVYGILAAGMLIIGAFDHFFWTLQQGILMWWLVWGVIAHSVKSR